MPISISVLFFFALYLSVLFWVRVRYKEQRKSEQRIQICIRALRRADCTRRAPAN